MKKFQFKHFFASYRAVHVVDPQILRSSDRSRSSASTSATVTTSLAILTTTTSFELASSHARVASIKSIKQQSVSQSVC